MQGFSSENQAKSGAARASPEREEKAEKKSEKN
jgi:hypothetical protein